MFKNKTKASIVLITTLFLGVIIGGLGSRFLAVHRIGRMAEMRHQKGYVRIFERLVDPTVEQADTVRAILERHHKRFSNLNDHHLQNVKMLMDSLRSELSTVLTEEQLSHLKELLDRPGFPPRGPRRRGFRPGPPGEGGFPPPCKTLPPVDDNN